MHKAKQNKNKKKQKNKNGNYRQQSQGHESGTSTHSCVRVCYNNECSISAIR